MGDVSSKSRILQCIQNHIDTLSNVTFEDMCKEILNCHVSQLEKEELLKAQTFEELVAKISPYTSEIRFPPFCATTEKQQVLAQTARERGNEYLKCKNYHQALISYTQSIAVAPAKCDSNCLAKAYANRSVVLQTLGLFPACLCDTQRALLHKYPENLCYKIMLRQGHCYVQMGMREMAVTILTKADKMIERADISDAEKQKLRGQVTACLMSAEQVTPSCDFIPAAHTPELSYGVNEEIPVLSSCVTLRYNQSRGRHLVAARHIQPGDVLGVEPAYCTVLMSENRFTHCAHCLRRSHSLLPCPNCSWAMYCHKSCQVVAWQSYHEFECAAMRNIERLNVRTIIPVLFAVRSVAVTGLERALDFHRDSPVSKNTESQRSRGFNASGKFLSSEFSVIYHQCSAVDFTLVYTALLAKCLVKILRLDTHPQASEITGLLMHLMCGHAVNCHEIYERYSSCATSAGDVAVGNGVYPALGLVNHSCDQNVVRHYYGKTTVLRAIKTIHEGEEIVDTYGPHFIADSKQDRQQMLKLHHNFDCECEACANNWQTQEKLPWSLPLPRGRNKRLLLQSSAQINDAIKNYIKDRSVVYADVAKLCQHLTLLDKLNRRMSQEYFVLQEIIKVSYATQANLYVCKE